MVAPDKLIIAVILSINWKNIKSFHKKLGITWIFENKDGEEYERVPTVPELKEDLKQILKHMHTEGITYISYGNWVIFWDMDNDEAGDIRVIFRIADFVIENGNTRERLELALSKAIEDEDYEAAAIIRDELKKEKR
jgi:hypothetical protein